MTWTPTRACTASEPVGTEAYLAKLVGQPWQRHGLHCWRLVVDVQRDLFGRTLPFDRHLFPVNARERTDFDALRALMSQKAEDYGWREVSAPVHGAVARMHRIGADPADLIHAGVYFVFAGGMVLHANHPHGVVLDTLPQLSARGWVARWFAPLEKDA